MPPTPHPRTPSPLIIVVWLSVPTRESGIGHLQSVFLFARPHGARHVFEIDLMADSAGRRHDGEVFERLLSPSQELVSLAVAT
jgi:hypothetical protein